MKYLLPAIDGVLINYQLLEVDGVLMNYLISAVDGGVDEQPDISSRWEC